MILAQRRASVITQWRTWEAKPNPAERKTEAQGYQTIEGHRATVGNLG